jgi:hypothetical protein
VLLHPAYTRRKYAEALCSGNLMFAKSVDASVETDYFQQTKFVDHGKRISRKEWHRRFRPDCVMVKATLTIHCVKPKKAG